MTVFVLPILEFVERFECTVLVGISFHVNIAGMYIDFNRSVQTPRHLISFHIFIYYSFLYFFNFF